MRWRLWNGIHIKKKSIKNNKSTIERKFKEYYVLLCWFSGLICVVMFLVAGIYTRTYNKMGDHIHWLDEMYYKIDDMQKAAEKYAFSEDEEWQYVYTDSLEAARVNVEKMEKLNIQGNYQRNLYDLKYLLESYAEGRNIIIEKYRSNGKEEEVLKEYQTLRDIYTAMLHKKEILYNEQNSYFNWQKTVMQEKLIWMFLLTISVLILGFLLVGKNTRRLSSSIVLPMKVLTKRAIRIQENDLTDLLFQSEEQEIYEKEKGAPIEEVRILDAAFCAMLKRIQEQIEELKKNIAVKERLKEQELENLRISTLLATSELHCLQMQMNPHFLFNTLNMIQQTIYLDKKEKTSFLLKETASFLRYSLDYVGKSVMLQMELEALGNYINLQEERLGDRILFEFELDESINQMEVPSLILQPLVENSLIHGVADKKENALIRIRTEYLKDIQIACISIADNGHGIQAEQLNRIRHSISRDNDEDNDKDKGICGINSDADNGRQNPAVQTKIGLLNVYKRLSIFTKGAAIMALESQPELGTQVIIKIPFVPDIDEGKGG